MGSQTAALHVELTALRRVAGRMVIHSGSFSHYGKGIMVWEAIWLVDRRHWLFARQIINRKKYISLKTVERTTYVLKLPT
jgi:hypothetical protein